MKICGICAIMTIRGDLNGQYEEFTDKADKYVSSRPSYPTKLMDYLYNEVGFSDKSKIADIGAGTGIFTRQLLERNSDVRCLHHILLRRMMKSLMNM